MGGHIHPGKGESSAAAPFKKPLYPNINEKSHKDCASRETYGGTYVGNLGDVRRCEHNKVQLLMKPERTHGGMVGPGTWFWHTLHPLWDFKLYNKATKALG